MGTSQYSIGGGGIGVGSSSGNIRIIDNNISNNSIATVGGGIYVVVSAQASSVAGNVTLANNTISQNIAGNNKGEGGGVYVYSSAQSGNIEMTGNNISDNEGGGLYIDIDDDYSLCSIMLKNNNIIANKLSSGSIYAGGLFINNYGEITLISNVINGNTGNQVGGVHISSSSNIILNNNIIAKNVESSSSANGGGVCINALSNTTVTLTNNSIVSNITHQNGGGLYLGCLIEDTISQIYNNIIWGNQGVEGTDIYNDSDIFAFANAHNNDFHGISGRPFSENINSIDEDPLFVSMEYGDFHLLGSSPCIDKGTADAPQLFPTDFEGNERIIGSNPDIGADEFDPSAPPTTTTITTTSLPSTTTSSSSGFCLSEVIYGDNSDETALLRYFRDDVLRNTIEGRELIRLYYLWSPVVIKAMEADDSFKQDVKEIIDKVLSTIE